MKIFERDSKVNFVDENNVFVGYDTDQSCCEHVGWFISDAEECKVYDGKFDLIKHMERDVSQYVFDKNYFKEDIDCGDQLDDGGMIRFKLTSPGRNDLFLHIFNAHNGYYGHGFEAKVNEKIWKEGCL